MRISDWSSDVCSSDLIRRNSRHACRYGHQPSGDQSANLDWRTGASGIATTRNSAATPQPKPGSGQEEYDGRAGRYLPAVLEGTYDISSPVFGRFSALVARIGSASCRERVLQYV